MRADNSHHIITAAHQRTQATRRRAVAALRRIDNAGTPVTFDCVAREAQVSRSWLYNQPDLRAEIDRLRNRRHGSTRPVPDRQRATDASLQQRLNAATARNRELEADNKQLRRALAEALGDRRTTPHRDTPRGPIQPAAEPLPQPASRTPSTTQTRSSQAHE